MGRWIFLGLLGVLFSWDVLATRGPIIRVRIAKALPSIVVAGSELKAKSPVVLNLVNRPGNRTLRFNCKGHDLTKNKSGGAQLLASLSTGNGVINWEKTPYLGSFDLLISKSGDACDVVNSLPMDSYISSLLAKEMNATWPLEALKAQAVAARSYALFQMDGRESRTGIDRDFFDIENSEKFQVNGSLHDTTDKTWKAAMDTSGEVLVGQKGNIAPTFFHAQCGGRTFTPREVWGNSVEGYGNVLCPQCQGAGKGIWKKEISSKELVEAISIIRNKGKLKRFARVNGTSNSAGRGFEVFNHQRLDPNIRMIYNQELIELYKSDLRSAIGSTRIPSNNFRVLNSPSGGLFIEGIGHGHGVGMCQIGALNLAREGKSYKEILQTYFPGLKLKKIY